MSIELGKMYYEVDIDTAGLVSSAQQVEKSAQQTSKSLQKAGDGAGVFEKKINEVSKAISGNLLPKLSKIAAGVATAFSAQQIISYANTWTSVNNKLINSVREHERLADVTSRVFEISQRSRVELSAVADLYGRIERATREMGLSTEHVADVTETVSKALVVSGASAQEASSSMIQLSQAIASGVLRGEEFNSISENGSRIMRALSDSLGLPIGQLRKLAADGKLTSDIVIGALREQASVIDGEFNNTMVTMGQAFTVAGNNAAKFVGETSMLSGGIQAFNGILITLSDNLDMIANVGMIVATVFGAKMVGSLVASTQAMIAQTMAAKSAAGAMGTLKGAMAFIGGPAGVAFLAGSAILYLFQQMQQAKKEAKELADNADILTESLLKMTQAELSANVIKWKESVGELYKETLKNDEALIKLNKSINIMEQSLAKTSKEAWNYSRNEQKLTELMDERTILIAEQEKVTKSLANVRNLLNLAEKKSVDGINLVIDAMSGEVRAATPLEDAMLKVKKAFMEATGAKENYNAVKLDTATDISNADKMIGKLGQEIELYTVAAGSARELMKAKQAAAMAGASEAQTAVIIQQTALLESLSKVEEDTEKARREAEKADKKGAKESAKAASQQIDYIQSLSDEVERLKNQMLGLGDINEAVFQLGADATAEQIAQVRELAIRKQGLQIVAEQQTMEQIANIREQGLASIDKLYKAEEISAEQSAQAKLRIERDFVQAKMDIASQSAVTPMQELQGTIDPLAQMANEHSQKLAMIEAYNSQVLASEQVSQEQIAGIHRQYDQQRLDAMWNIWKQQSTINEMLGSAFDSLASTASNSLTGFITGTMTAKEAAQNLGRTIFNSIINSLVQMGIEAVKNMILGQTMGAAAAGVSVAQASLVGSAWAPAAMAASVATLGSASAVGSAAFTASMAGAKALGIAGGRRTGGPVESGQMYRVGENNRPEIYQTSRGESYMITGDKGRVIPNSEISGSGQQVVNVNVINNNGSQVQTRQSQTESGLTLEVLIEDADQGGPYVQALQRNYNIERKTD